MSSKTPFAVALVSALFTALVALPARAQDVSGGQLRLAQNSDYLPSDRRASPPPSNGYDAPQPITPRRSGESLPPPPAYQAPPPPPYQGSQGDADPDYDRAVAGPDGPRRPYRGYDEPPPPYS